MRFLIGVVFIGIVLGYQFSEYAINLSKNISWDKPCDYCVVYSNIDQQRECVFSCMDKNLANWHYQFLMQDSNLSSAKNLTQLLPMKSEFIEAICIKAFNITEPETFTSGSGYIIDSTFLGYCRKKLKLFILSKVHEKEVTTSKEESKQEKEEGNKEKIEPQKVEKVERKPGFLELILKGDIAGIIRYILHILGVAP